MAEVEETDVERDEDGRVIGYRQHIERPRKRGGFGWGLLLGMVLVAGGIVAFAYSHGSFQSAGVTADHATAQVEQQASNAAHQAGDQLNNAGDQAQQTAQQTEQNAQQ